ncbi:hypothetical protein AAHZ94_16500 [Streptomyces sp. HSW2009]|uniref:hypothetical protein n=1 Tax=Streptomyces sp. HSW2009 TaxID=3142890 RepID=UPI0032F04B73
MAEVTPYQSHREALEVAMWQAPAPRPDEAARAAIALVDSDGNDQAVGNKVVGDGSSLPDLGPLSNFGSWETVAVTILHKAATISDFNPESEVYDPVAWNNYLQKFSTLPFFLSYTSDTRNASISLLSLEKGVSAVSDLLQNIVTEQNRTDIVETIKKVAQLAVESDGQPQKQSNVQVGLVSRHAGQLYVGVVRTTVEMQYKSGKGYEPLSQTLDIGRGYGVLDFEKCKRSTSKLLEWDHRSVDEWERGTGSAQKPPNQSPAWDH